MRLTVFLSLLLVLLLSALPAYQCVDGRPLVSSKAWTQEGEKVHTHLLILFLSHAGDDRRTSLRETWLRDNANETRWVFVIGNIDNARNKEAILKEQAKYEDIIILNDVIDTYDHLSDKVLKGFKAVHSRYTFDFLLKTDTDTYVVLPRLLEYLSHVPTKQMYIGQFARSADPKELWYGLLREVYYMLGGGYLLTYDLVEYFAYSQHLMRRSRSEDVTIGIHLHSIEHTMDALNDTLFKASASETCSCVSTLILNHKCRKNEMYFMYYSYQQSGEFCEYKKSTQFMEEMARKYSIPDPFPNTSVDEKLRWT